MARIKNLNNIFDYSLLGKNFTPSLGVQKVIDNHAIVTGDDWYLAKFNSFRKEFKEFYVNKQTFRCGICRFKIQADGHYQDIDHIIPKSRRKKWIFTSKNLICTCTPCNRLKNADNTMHTSYNRARAFPDDKNAYLVFNPHYDKWSDHFQIEDGIFITAKSRSKGYYTIQVYRLFRYQICINLAAEQESPNFKNDAIKVLKKLYKTTPGSKEEKELKIVKKKFEKFSK